MVTVQYFSLKSLYPQAGHKDQFTLWADIESLKGYDSNDLDLEIFCETIVRELRELTAHLPAEALPENFCFVETNLCVKHTYFLRQFLTLF